MKLASFESDGMPGWGVLRDAGLIDGRHLLGGRYGSLRALLEADAVAALRAAFDDAPSDSLPVLDMHRLRWLPPVPAPDKILCVGLNYQAHVTEMGRALPAEPSIFVRVGASLVGHAAPIIRPRVSERLDFEGELAVVIGKGGRHITQAQALSHVAGYSLFNDASVRDWQKHSVAAGKNFASTGAFGPWLLSADEVPDPSLLTLRTRVNGVQMQYGQVSTMCYSIPALIAYLSQIMPLVPGDVIATGTPSGVGSGRQPPVWLRAGDMVEVEIAEIGVLRNPVADEA